MTEKKAQKRVKLSKATPRKRTIPGNVHADMMADESGFVFNARPSAPIVPQANIAGQSLTLLIAIMSFIACLTLGAVSLVDQSARTWQGQIAREATIQIRPADGFDMEAALQQARSIASDFEGVRDARIISQDDTAALLEPWLGGGLDFDELPIPRLVIVTIDENAPPDFEAMRSLINETVDNATLDDHRAWVSRLVTMARTTTWVGLAILVLVLGALALTVVFATRGAMAGNHDVIEVLHFVGARGSFIANQFQRRFLMIGLRGALAGGVLAMLAFFMTSAWAQRNLASFQGEQIAALFGDFSIGLNAYIGVCVLIVVVGLLTALTTRQTVLGSLRDIDERRSDPSL